jgi:hypothetical protein
VFVYLTFVFAFNFYNENHPKINKYNITFIGDSHTRYSIIPESFGISKNYGLNGDPLVAQKWKLNTLIDCEKLDTVIMSLGYHTFAENLTDIFSKKDGLTEKLLNRYLFIEPDYLSKIKITKIELLKSCTNKLKKPTYEISYLGGFVKIQDCWDRKSGWRINQHFQTKESQISSIIQEVEDIITLCKINKVVCFFHLPPVTSVYKNRVPKNIVQSTDSFLNVLNARGLFLPTVQTLPDSCFFDPDHLNYSGAKIYTHSLKQALYDKKKRPQTNL